MNFGGTARLLLNMFMCLCVPCPLESCSDMFAVGFRRWFNIRGLYTVQVVLGGSHGGSEPHCFADPKGDPTQEGEEIALRAKPVI